MPESSRIMSAGGEFVRTPQRDGLRFMFIDFNAFFASVEQNDDPSIAGRPTIVTPLASEHSGAIAASYEAKALGIGRGTSVKDARALYPDIAIRPARHDRYVAVHHQLMREIERHLPILRICSIDECVCRLDPREAGAEAARAKARKVKAGIYENVGPMLRASIGLSTSALLAKLAGELVKPDGLTVIDAADLPDVLADLPLRAIPGVGEGIHTRLTRAGITDFTTLWRLAPKHARAIWGSVAGERFLYALRGHDVPEQPVPDKKMIGHSRVLSNGYRTPEGARIVARALILKAASRLRHLGLHAAAMDVTVKLVPEGALTHEARFRGTQNSWRFLRELDAFWHQMMAAAGRRSRSSRNLRLKHVSVQFHGLSAGPPLGDLFVSQDDEAHDRREAALWRSIDRLNARYGMQKIMLASQQALDLNYLGVKIAFSRVPDAAEFADIGGLERVAGQTVADHERRSQNPARAIY
ncbi:MAG: hypothetical protein AAGD40_08320 [Pseudomonadota bacterium]